MSGAGFYQAWTTPMASDPPVEPRQDDYIKGICSPGSKGLNPCRTQLDRAGLMLHSHEIDMSSLIFQM